MIWTSQNLSKHAALRTRKAKVRSTQFASVVFGKARRASTLANCAILLSALVACSGEDDARDLDAGIAMSSDASPVVASDGGGSTPNSGSAGQADTGSALASDASTPAKDSGAQSMDAGDPKSEAGGPVASAGACTRALLKMTVDQYFAAMEKHDPSTLSLSATVKYTEKGKMVELGQGLWKTAGAVKFKRSAFDTETCNSVTESVVADGSTDIVFGLRLKLVDQKIAEIESIPVHSGDYFVAPNTGALMATSTEDWEALLPEADRSTRADLTAMIDKYFLAFPAGACNFASDCKRLENGFSPGGCTAGLSCSDAGTGMARGGMKPRLYVLDVEAGIAVGFVMFASMYTDFHLFRVRAGQVHGVHAVLAAADGPGW